MRKCKICGVRFRPFNTLQRTCLQASCVLENLARVRHRKKLEELRESTKTLSYYKKQLTQVFNKFIRSRDKGKPCISCLRPLGEYFDAGHYFSRGAYPNLAWTETNVHGQCRHCNQFLSGNLINYSINLPNRIGAEAYNELINRRNDAPQKFTKEEIINLIKTYKTYGKIKH
jgi:hypothetical protein